MGELKLYINRLLLTTTVLFFCAATAMAGNAKPVAQVKGKLSVMVLGSGGPLPPAGRASSSYLIFVDGKARILMDAGGGSFNSLSASGAVIKDLDIVLLSHLHIDHTADLSAFVKGIYFQSRGAGTKREAPINIYGPGANGATFPNSTITQYPSTKEYVDGHYNMETGVQRYLNVFAKAISAGNFAYTANDIDPDVTKDVATVYDKDGLVIKAIGVVHGPVPSLAYRIEYGGASLVFSGDTNSKTGNMSKISKGTDLLIYDTAIMDDVPNVEKNPADKVFFALHTTPSRMGEVASEAAVKTLLLSHITPITQPHLDKIKATVKAKGFKGKTVAAEDLKVYNLP